MIILLPNVPTLSNVSELWSELGQPPDTPDQSANGMKTFAGGVSLRTVWFRVTKRSPGVNGGTAFADSAGAMVMYFSTNPCAHNRREERAHPQAIDHLDLSVFVLAHVKLTMRENRGSLEHGRAYGPGDAVAWHDKDTWIGGVNAFL